jgi:hypothetical protein
MKCSERRMILRCKRGTSNRNSSERENRVLKLVPPFLRPRRRASTT